MDLRSYLARQRKFSDATFGVGMRTVGVTRHIEKECEEIRAKPHDLEEWIDVIILALDGFSRAGGNDEDLERLLWAKLAKNMAREWPAHMPEDQPVEHLR